MDVQLENTKHEMHHVGGHTAAGQGGSGKPDGTLGSSISTGQYHGGRGAAAPAGAAAHTRLAATPTTAAAHHAEPLHARPALARDDGAVQAGGAAAVAGASNTTHQQRDKASNQESLTGMVIFLHGSIPLLQRRAKIITQRLQQLGAAVHTAPITAATRPTDLARSISHIVLHPSDVDGSSSGGGSSRSSSSSGKQGVAASVHQVLHLMQQLRQLQAQSRPSHKEQQQQQQQQRYIVRLVSDEWLDAVLSAGEYVPEQQYSLEGLLGSAGGSSSSSGDSDDEGGKPDSSRASKRQRRQQQQQHLAVPPRMPALEPSPDAPMGRYAMWLGGWEPSFNAITTQVEVVLHGSFDAGESAARGPNEAVRAALKELEAFEIAVAVKDAGWGPGAIAHEALTYAHAAAVVRGCCFPLSPALSARRLQQLLPFVGAFTASVIHQLLTTGSCEQLESFRANQPVRNSRGQLRPGTAGGAARAAFVKLPGVGPALAEAWWSAGYSSLPGLLRAAAEEGLLLPPPAAAAGTGGGVGAVDWASVGCSGVDGSAPGVTAAAQSLPRQVRVGQPDTAAAAAASGVGTSGRGRGAGHSGSIGRNSSMSTATAPTTGGGAAAGNEAGAAAAAAAAAAGSAAAVLPFGREALYSLRYSGDLLSGTVSADELEEMNQFLLESLAAVTGVSDGWKLQLVGGGRRSSAVHDVDYLVGHESDDSLLVGLVGRLYSSMVAAGRVVAEDEGFCRVQRDRMPTYKEKARMDVLLGRFDSNHQMDHYDHIWCIHVSPAGRRRRWDLMFIPSSYWAMAVVGWSGSKQYLRFMRQHAGNCGMNLNSHFLMRAVDLLPAARHTAATLSPGAAASSGLGTLLHAAAPSNPPTAAAAAAAAQTESAGRGGNTSQASASGSLAEAVEYTRAAAASGSIRVVLSVPDEAPPTDRSGKEWWPSGWQPAHIDAAAGADGAAAGEAAGGVATGKEAVTGITQSSHSMNAKEAASVAAASDRGRLAALVQSGPGSERSIVREQDLFELLGVPFLEPNQRNC